MNSVGIIAKNDEVAQVLLAAWRRLTKKEEAEAKANA